MSQISDENPPESNNNQESVDSNISKENATEAESISTLELIKNRDFFSIFASGSISMMGTFFAYIAIIFLVLSLNSHLSEEGAARVLALVILVRLIPSLIIGPFAGVVVDRMNRKTIMIVADLFSATISFSFVFVTNMNQVYALTLASATISLFFYPSQGAIIPVVVKQEGLMKANALMSSTTQLSRIIGPAAAGILIAAFGLNVGFIVDGITFIVSAFFVYRIEADLRPPKQDTPASVVQVVRDLGTGLKITFNNRVLRFLFLTLMVMMIGIGMIDPLFPSYLKFDFGMGEQDYGLIISFAAITGLIIAITLTVKEVSTKLTLITIITFIAGIGMIVLGSAVGFDNPIFVLYIGMGLIGMVNVGFSVPMATVMQTMVKNEHMGKVQGIFGTVIMASILIGATIAALIIGLIEISVIYSGIGIFLCLIAIGAFIVIRLSHLENYYQVKSKEIAELSDVEAPLIIDAPLIPASDPVIVETS